MQIKQKYMDVSKNSGTPKSSIWIGFSIINHPFRGTPIFGNTHIQVIVQMKPERADHSCEGVLFTANYLRLPCSYLPIGAFETS